MYDKTVTYTTDKRVCIFRFGREENAIADMKTWLRNIDLLPVELKELGCTREDVEKWVNSIESRKRGSKLQYVGF